MSIARFITEHHMGMVFERASGIFFPDRVESTRMMLDVHDMSQIDSERDISFVPLVFNYQGQKVEVGASKIKAPVIIVAVSRLEIRRNWGGLRISEDYASGKAASF